MTVADKFGRRGLIAAGTLAAATALGRPALAQAPVAAGATPAGWNDGLAHPIPYTPSPGLGKERGLVLGGGGAYLVSWMMGYFHALKQNGVDLATADVVVGTSAGSIAGAVLSSGRLWRLTGELDIFANFPKLFAELVPALQANPSQERARKLAVDAQDASFETIRNIGRAAMAAHNPAGTDKYFSTLHRLIGPTTWPSPAPSSFFISCADAMPAAAQTASAETMKRFIVAGSMPDGLERLKTGQASVGCTDAYTHTCFLLLPHTRSKP